MAEFGTVLQMGKRMIIDVSQIPIARWTQSQHSTKFVGPYLRPNGLTQSNNIWYDNTG